MIAYPHSPPPSLISFKQLYSCNAARLSACMHAYMLLTMRHFQGVHGRGVICSTPQPYHGIVYQLSVYIHKFRNLSSRKQCVPSAIALASICFNSYRNRNSNANSNPRRLHPNSNPLPVTFLRTHARTTVFQTYFSFLFLFNRHG